MIWRFSLLFGLTCYCCISACTTWKRHGVVFQPPQKLQIAVLPVRNTVSIERLKQLEMRPKGEKPPPNEKTLVEERMQQITAQMTKSLEGRLNTSYFFETVSLEDFDMKGPLSKKQAKQIGEKLHVPAILTVRLDGYGKVRPAWVAFFLTMGVVEGTAQGVLAAVTTGNTWVAVGLAAEEVLQETAESVGGTLLFNKFFTPVILEAKLWSTVDGGELWHKTVIATPHHKALKELSKEERKKREVRLQLSYDRAQASLAKSLEKAAARNMHSRLERLPVKDGH